MADKKVYILCRFAEKSRLYAPWLGRMNRRYEVVKDYVGGWHPPTDCGLLVTHIHYRWEDLRILRALVEENRVPVLILADGILEYRNIYEHPDLADGSVFQPILGHKLACIGRGQARVIESWGNLGKCEVVGMPWFDQLGKLPPAPVQHQGNFRLLICTANTPAFNETQRRAVVDALTLLKNRFETNPWVNGRRTEVTWRLTDRLDQELGLPLPADDVPRRPLHEELDHADAVITTPSTVYLESLFKGRPTALLDFHNTPHFVPAAWMINAPKHMNTILNELAAPPAAKMLFQNMTLHDQLECADPSTPRLLTLMETLIEAGEAAASTGQPLELPPRILPDDRRGFPVVESGFNLAQLFPRNPVLKNNDIERLQLELNAAIQRLNTFPEELERRVEGFHRQKANYEKLSARFIKVRDQLNQWKQIAKSFGVNRLPDNEEGLESEEGLDETLLNKSAESPDPPDKTD